MTDNLNDMTIDELKELKKKVERAISSFEERKKAEARKALEEHANEMGFKLEELVSSRSAKTKKPVTPKYQHPENPAITWAGRGRKPKWVVEHLDAGRTLDQLLIE
jgi:DNA-binding protein H-NS